MGDTELTAPEGKPTREPTPEELGMLEEQRKARIRGYIALLKDPNLTFRWKAAEALGTVGDSTAIEPLLEALKDPVCRCPVACRKVPRENWGQPLR